MVELRHAVEEIEILFAPRLQLWVDRLFQVPAPLCEIKLLAKAEDAQVRVTGICVNNAILNAKKGAGRIGGCTSEVGVGIS